MTESCGIPAYLVNKYGGNTPLAIRPDEESFPSFPRYAYNTPTPTYGREPDLIIACMSIYGNYHYYNTPTPTYGRGADPCFLGLSSTQADYGSYLNWIAHADATLTFPQTVVLRYTLQEAGRADKAAEDYGDWYIARLRYFNAVLTLF